MPTMKHLLLSLFMLLTLGGAAQYDVNTLVRQGATNTLEQFGGKGDDGANDYPAFIKFAASTEKVLQLEAKEYIFDNGTGTIAQQLAAVPLLTNKYIVGKKGTVVKFTSCATPAVLFYDCAYGGIKDVEFVFTGTTITTGSQQPSKAQFMTKLGVSTLSGGDVKEIGPVYVFNSSNMDFANLIFRSNTPGNINNMMGMCMTVRAREDVPTYNYNLQMNNIGFYDCQNGALICSQRGAVISTIRSSRRGGITYYPPGHVIYFSANNGITENTLACTDLIDYGDPISGSDMEQNLATLSCKYMRGCKVSNVTSYHPQGLIQSFDNANQNTFTDFSHYYDGEATGSFMNFVGPTAKSSSDNVFDGFNIITPNSFSYIATTSSLQNLFERNVFRNFYFRMQPNYNSSQGAALGVFDVYGNNNQIDAKIELTEPVNSSNFNGAVVYRGTSTNNTSNIQIVGQNMDQRFIRPLASAGTVNKFRWNLPVTSAGQYFGGNTPYGNVQGFEPMEDRIGKGSISTTGTGLTDTVAIRTGPGAYMVTATVSNNAVPATSGVVATYNLIWSAGFGVASAVGTPLTFGTGYSNLVLSVDSNGIITLTFDKAPAGAARINITITYRSGTGSNI